MWVQMHMERLEHKISHTPNDTMLGHQLSPKHELLGNEFNNVYLDIQQLTLQSPRACLHLSTIANKASCKTSNGHYLLFELHHKHKGETVNASTKTPAQNTMNTHKCLGLMFAHAHGQPSPSVT